VASRAIEGLPLELGIRPSAPVVGIEHEYRVLDGDEQLNFADLLHGLNVDGVRLDPTDPNAYRCNWGGLITVDGREAEVATPPVALGPGCLTELDWRANGARSALATVLPPQLHLDGYSTHLSVELADRDVVGAGRLFVTRFAPAMMLLLDRPSSPGLLVRPRRGRFELGGEYCTGDQLRVAAAFAAAASLTCADALRSRATRRHLPAAVRARVRPSNIRAGWYVDRHAFGADLYRDGRRTRLRLTGGRTRTAQAHLHEAWACSRPTIETLLAANELELVDRVVDGTAPLPLEADPTTTETNASFDPNPFERVGRARCRPRFTVEPVAIGWDAVVFSLVGERNAIACIPRRSLDVFLDDLDAERLDEPIGHFLASPPSGRVLQAADQTRVPGLFDEVSSTEAIAPPERKPGRPPRFGARSGGPPGDRRSKSRRPPRRPRRALVAAGILVAVLVAAGVALASRGTNNKTAVPVAATSTSTTTSTVAPTTQPDPAIALTGNWAVTRAVTDSDNPSLPVGSNSDVVYLITAICNAGPCGLHVEAPGILGAVERADLTRTGDAFAGAITGSAPCGGINGTAQTGTTGITGTITLSLTTPFGQPPGLAGQLHIDEATSSGACNPATTSTTFTLAGHKQS
jgi:hypothetical protein